MESFTFQTERLQIYTRIGCALQCVLAPIKYGGADKNLDWLCRKSEAVSVFEGTEGAKRELDSLFVVPADVGVNGLDELLNGCGLPTLRIEQLRFQQPEETLTSRIVGRTPFSRHRADQLHIVHS